jgi:hypothetical protein
VGFSAYGADSALGTWKITEWRPPACSPLFGPVEAIWHWDGVTVHPRERTFPNGRFELIVQLDEPYRPGADDPLPPFPALCVGGMYRRPWVVEAPRKRCRVMGVRLTPSGAFAILSTPLSLIAGTTVALDDVVGPRTHELGERCYAARSAAECISVVARWASGRITRATAADPAVAWLADAIEASDGTVAIDSLERRLAAPAARITTAGYYDQPHLNAEFRQHAGMTPRAFLRSLRYPNSPSLIEPA